MKKQQKKNKLKMPKTEKGNLENFLKIKRAIHLGRRDYFVLAMWMVAGAVIIPLFCRLSIGALFDFLASILRSSKPDLILILSFVQIFFDTFQWLFYAALVSLYWFRCNIRIYNFHFTREVVRKIRAQSSLTGKLRCPRCGYTMAVHSFFETGEEYVGDRTEYDLEQYRVGKEYRVRTVKKFTPEYRDVRFERQYAMCQNLYCLFEEKKPYGKDARNYKFFEMPYRISDTLHYAVWTNNDTVRLTGNLRRYRHGVSFITCLVLTVLVFSLSAWRGYDSIFFLFRETVIEAELASLCIYLGIALGISVLTQAFVHITHKSK